MHSSDSRVSGRVLKAHFYSLCRNFSGNLAICFILLYAYLISTVPICSSVYDSFQRSNRQRRARIVQATFLLAIWISLLKKTCRVKGKSFASSLVEIKENELTSG